MTPRLPALLVGVLAATALSIFVTWPQAEYLSSHIAAHHDAYFSIWRLNWVAHALATSPSQLFNANIFYPATQTLAYSDATLLQGLIATPLLWAGVPPVPVYNLLLLAGFIGSGVAMFVLTRHLTDATGPALVAAAVFTMAPYRIEHVMHLELQWAMFIPLTFWALHRATEETSWRWGTLAGLFFGLQVLSCVYYGLFLGIALVAFVPALLVAGRHSGLRSLVPVYGAAALAALLLSVPYAVPYVAASRLVGERHLDEITRYSATAWSYLSAPGTNRFWGWTSDRWGGPELRLFPGFTAVLLALISLVARPTRRVALYALVAVVAVELSFGVNGLPYRLLFARVDALHGFRSLSRFDIIAECALAVLAAFGTQQLGALTCGSARRQGMAVAALLGLMMLEYGNRPMALMAGNPAQSPDVYTLIRRAGPGAVVELPMPKLNTLPGAEPVYLAASLWHWKPLVNGYSGYYPPDYLETVLRMESFPDEGSIGRLRGHDVRYVIVHRRAFEPQAYSDLLLRIATRPELRPWGAYRDLDGLADIFELLPGD